MTRPLGGDGDEDLGGSDDLGPRRVVLADPGLIPAEPVEMLDQLEVAFERQRRVLPRLVERRHEDPEAEMVGHGCSVGTLNRSDEPGRRWATMRTHAGSTTAITGYPPVVG